MLSLLAYNAFGKKKINALFGLALAVGHRIQCKFVQKKKRRFLPSM